VLQSPFRKEESLYGQLNQQTRLNINMIKLGLQIYKKLIDYYFRIKYFFYDILGIKVGEHTNLNDFENIGFIDQDGLIHVPLEYQRLFNPNDIYTSGEFMYRIRHKINILYSKNAVLVEKNFKNDSFHFYNEVSILYELKDCDCVSTICFVDFKNHKIAIKYIDGFVLREKLAKLGAKIRDVDKLISDKKEVHKYVDLATAFNQITNIEILNKIKESVDQIHRKKILIRDIKYGNIIIKNERPYLFDFDESLLLKHTPRFFFDAIKKSDLLKLKDILKCIEFQQLK
jgi:serine/threonine protein kinase